MFLPLLTAAALCAQVPENTLGIGASGYVPLGYTAPASGMTIDATRHLGRGIDLYMRVVLYSVPQQARVPNAPVVRSIWTTGASTGVRYLFLEGPLRPWLGAHFTNFHSIRPATLGRVVVGAMAGGGASTGFDWAAGPVIFSARATWDLVTDVGFVPSFYETRHHLGGAVTASLGF